MSRKVGARGGGWDVGEKGRRAQRTDCEGRSLFEVGQRRDG